LVVGSVEFVSLNLKSRLVVQQLPVAVVICVRRPVVAAVGMGYLWFLNCAVKKVGKEIN